MKAALRLRNWAACLAALVLLAFSLTFVAELAGSSAAQAQSSVRPPANVSNPVGGAVPGEAIGFSSDSETWRKVRKGVQGTVSIPDKKAGQLVQSEGDSWRGWKNGPLSTWGALALGATVLLLILFYLGRGKITIEHGWAKKTITRFDDIERVAHWLLAVSFIILALTGLNITYGKYVLMPLIGKGAFATLSAAGKWLHNYVAFAFTVGLVMIFVLWVKDNIPNRYDLAWLAKGGGLFVKGVHPPSKKFNAGQKLIFWSVVLGGTSLILSGISLLFPFQFAMFAKTFAILNIFGFDLPTQLTPIQEMQYATLWHAIVAIGLICIIVAHIYIGTIGMEGAFDAMGSGEVDINWAKEHHSIWAEEVLAASAAPKRKGKRKGGSAAAPAE